MKRLLFYYFFIAALPITASPLFFSQASDLKKLEKAGLNFTGLLCPGTIPSSTESLYTSCSAYRRLSQILEADLQERAANAVTQMPETPFDRFSESWLRSRATSLRLIGAVARFDRKALLTNSCGERRLIFRLFGRFQDAKINATSYLPFTLMVVEELPGEHCSQQAKAYRESGDPLRWFSKMKEATHLRLETNLLGLRIESPVLVRSAGYAEYVMRVFRWRKDESLTIAPLENTPDVEKLKNDSALRERLTQWLRAQSEAIDTGEVRIPDEYLAKRAVSISPFGAVRLANAPFSALSLLVSQEVLRRLNKMSCQGCHQTGSVAGFHFLGEKLPKSFALNGTLLPSSTHFYSEQPWRQQFLKTMSESGVSLPRPVPGRSFGAEGQPGDECTTQTKSKLPCQAGVSCRELWSTPAHPEIAGGYCQKTMAPMYGEPFIFGSWQERNSLDGGLTEVYSNECYGHALPLPHEIGFPGGMCSGSCRFLIPGTICHPVPSLQKFTDCIARERGFKKCLETAAEPTALRACGFDMPCRPDYVCATSKEERGKNLGQGACVPPYFLPQLNIRNHRF